jgi:hypothetical protein
MVFVDRTAPEVLEITQQDSELIIPITEPCCNLKPIAIASQAQKVLASLTLLLLAVIKHG